MAACSTTPAVSYLPPPEIPLREDLRRACPNPEPPTLTAGLVPAADSAVADGDGATALVVLPALSEDYRTLMAFAVQLAAVTYCERARRSEIVSLIDAAGAEP